jgi:hypothetical protein
VKCCEEADEEEITKVDVEEDEEECKDDEECFGACPPRIRPPAGEPDWKQILQKIFKAKI